MDEASSLVTLFGLPGCRVVGLWGVATAFGGRDDEAFWSAGQRFRFFDLLVHSGVALFASLGFAFIRFKRMIVPRAKQPTLGED